VIGPCLCSVALNLVVLLVYLISKINSPFDIGLLLSPGPAHFEVGA